MSEKSPTEIAMEKIRAEWEAPLRARLADEQAKRMAAESERDKANARCSRMREMYEDEDAKIDHFEKLNAELESAEVAKIAMGNRIADLERRLSTVPEDFGPLIEQLMCAAWNREHDRVIDAARAALTEKIAALQFRLEACEKTIGQCCDCRFNFAPNPDGTDGPETAITQCAYHERQAAEFKQQALRLDATLKRYQWAANELLACDYGDNDAPGKQVGWHVYGWRHRKDGVDRRIYGPSIDAAVDAALGAKDKGE